MAQAFLKTAGTGRLKARHRYPQVKAILVPAIMQMKLDLGWRFDLALVGREC